MIKDNTTAKTISFGTTPFYHKSKEIAISSAKKFKDMYNFFLSPYRKGT